MCALLINKIKLTVIAMALWNALLMELSEIFGFSVMRLQLEQYLFCLLVCGAISKWTLILVMCIMKISGYIHSKKFLCCFTYKWQQRHFYAVTTGLTWKKNKSVKKIILKKCFSWSTVLLLTISYIVCY